MSQIIPIKNNPNHTIIINLDDKLYTLWFLYNTYGDFWTLTIYDENDTILVSGLKIVANYPLLNPYKRNTSLPKGNFYCQTSDFKMNIGRKAFADKKATLLYLAENELDFI